MQQPQVPYKIQFPYLTTAACGPVEGTGETQRRERCETGLGVLVPTLYAIFFSTMLQEAKKDLHERVCMRFRTDESVFSLRRLLAGTKTLEKPILDLLFADFSNS